MATLLSYALTTVADVKESLGIAAGNSTKDNLIIRKINQATEMIERYCGGRRFVSTAYTNEEYNGTGSNQIVLKQRPIVSVTSLEARTGTTNVSSWATIGTEFYFQDANAGLIDLVFTTQAHWNRYRITYTAGYTTIPSDLAEACCTLAAYLVDNATTGTAVKSKQEGGRKIEFFDPSAGSTNNSLFTQLNIDDILDTYSNYPLSEK